MKQEPRSIFGIKGDSFVNNHRKEYASMTEFLEQVASISLFHGEGIFKDSE
jgi:hypothetical protein